MDGWENDGYYLGNVEKTCLPHGFCRMVAKVLIILRSDDGQKPL